ncbi:hypothetical protein BGZ65_004383 [Modicella reniformis]|uniref:Nuclear cap-binding protein subunit 3 n=1 Tax=Modicella reniformis TaxID=1440133 RepID=A0A9P6INB7_9FUNG|nr:hypothetical protein BGZ65_004383 [Modicella reniformis]
MVSGLTAPPTDAAFRDSMLELEQQFEEQTRDISSRFQSERRPQPPGLDRALGEYNDNNNNRSQRGDNSTQQKYASKHGGFVTEERAKKANRALRFGGSPQVETPVKDVAMDEQGAGMDVDESEWVNLPETPPRTSTIRLEAVHLYGTDEMSTKDVLKYFEAYGPTHVEWIDDSSCNVIFPDQFSAKRALYLQLVDSDVNFGEDEDLEPTRPTTEPGTALVTTITSTMTASEENSNTITALSTGTTEVVMLQKSNNRLQRAKDYIPGQQQQNNTGLHIRYATDYDRKERGAAARSQYYAIHGREDPNIQRSSSGGGMGASRAPPAVMVTEQETSWVKIRLRLTIEIERSFWIQIAWLLRETRAGKSVSGFERKRGRRGDISLRLGGRINVPDVEEVVADASSADVAPIALYTSRTESRLNQYADDFLAELESTFSRREKAIPSSRMYSDYYEREVVTETPTDPQTTSGSRGRRERDRERDRDGRRGGGRGDDLAASEASPGGGGGRGKRGDQKREREREREEALKALDARLGLPIDDRVDEFGRARRD